MFNSSLRLEDFQAWIEEHLGRPCKYCSDESVEIDHIIPLSKGGAHVISNLQMLCKFCNKAKWDWSEEEFLNKINKIKANKTND